MSPARRGSMPAMSLAAAMVMSAMVLAHLQEASGKSEERGGRTRVVLLGTGTPVPDPARSGPALAVVVEDRAYLVDCGPGIVRQAAAAWEKGISALEPSGLQRVFITHLHSDHTLGLPDLIFTPWVIGRQQPLEVYGPEGISAMTRNLLEAYEADIRIRSEGYEKKKKAGCRVEAHEIEPGVVYSDELVTVKAFPVEHGSWKQAFGFRFETSDRTIVVSGDTRPSERLIEEAQGVDVLVHEVYAHSTFQHGPSSWQRYHKSFHTSTLELARIAQQAKPKLLVLTHQLFFGATAEDVLAEITSEYSGTVVSGSDLDVF